MRKSRVLALAGVSLLAVGVLAACSSSNSSKGASTAYNYVYTADPETLDYVTSGKASTADFVTNGVDGLLENDQYGNFVPSVAESWTVSKDGLTYTYKIRKDAKWYTSEGEEYGAVTAHDFVTGLKHAADKKSEALYLVQQSVKGLDDYVNGKTTDFSTVGVKAVDDHTLQYTLNQPEPQWNSKTTSQILWPVNEEFLTKQGDKFGQSTDPTSILYNGPFLMKSVTAKSAVEYQKNENYWDKENVHIDTIKLSYFDGQDQDSLARSFKDSVYTVARLYPTSSNYAGVEKEFKDNIFFTPPSAGVAVMGVNIDRQSYNHTSKTSDVATRYEKYAAAQAWLTDNSLVVPLMANPGAAPFLSRVEPFSGAYAQTGNKTSSTYFKYMKLKSDAVTKKDYDSAREKWLKEKEESNAKAQKDLESHVE